MGRFGWFLVVLLALPFLGLAGLSLWSRRHGPLAPPTGKLNDCPETPNCVCSQATRDSQRVAPLMFIGSGKNALDKLARILGDIPRVRNITRGDDWLRAECVTAIFRFIDDFEALVDDEKKEIHLRSASRVGRSDLGANRARVEDIRRRWQ